MSYATGAIIMQAEHNTIGDDGIDFGRRGTPVTGAIILGLLLLGYLLVF